MPVISDQRGAVMVLMAAALFPMVALLAFVVDVSHWFDYSRNLQNRADAAALAGSQELINCFTDTTTTLPGKWAQLYSGAGANEPAGNLPYTDAVVQSATGYKVSSYGYLNNTTSFSTSDPTSVDSPLTLKKGSLNDFYLILNGSNYHDKGGTNFSMAAPGVTATACASDPQYDQTEVGTPAPAGAMVDVKLSQENLPLFFPLISGRPTLHAHARAFLEGQGGSGVAVPIAVSDPGSTKCITAYFKYADGPNQGQDVVPGVAMTETNVTTMTWTSPATQLPTPLTGNVYVQAFLNDCGSPPSGQTYDPASGVLLINVFSTAGVSGTQPPQITAGGVTLASGGGCDQYFSSITTSCSVQVTANVAFNNSSGAKVTAVDTGTGNSINLHNGPGNEWDTNGPGLTVSPLSGQHAIEIQWEQTKGSVGSAACSSNNTNPCKGTFGIQAQSFAACNGCDPPDDSGPIILAQLSSGLFTDTMAFARTSQPTVTLTLQLAGIRVASSTAPPTVLRYSTSSSTTNHQTGLVDCTPDGTGSGSSTAYSMIYGGCGPTNPFINVGGQFSLPPLNTLYLNTRGNCTTPAPPTWPGGNQQDCVQTTPGSKSVAIPCAIVLRITGQAITDNCNGNNAGTQCPVNNWPAIRTNPDIGKNDPRKIQMVLVAPLDLQAASSQGWVQIKRFATFYVTGWDPGIKPSCNTNGAGAGKNESLSGKQNSNAAIWGHWINDVQPGVGNQQGCDFTNPEPTTCVPVLTR